MAEEIGLDPLPVFIELAPALERTFKGLAVAAVAAALRMGDAVIDRTAFQKGVQFTAAVPETGERADVRRIALVTGPGQDLSCRSKGIIEIVVTVDQNEGVIVWHDYWGFPF